MQDVPIEPWILEALAVDLVAWQARSGKASLDASVADYQRLLTRNRKLEERMDALQGETYKLQEEKSSLLGRMTELHTEAQQGKEVVELRKRLTDFQSKNNTLDKELSELRGKYISLTDTRNEEMEVRRQMGRELKQLRADKADLTVELADLHEVLDGEKDGREAARCELEERLKHKEDAEVRAEGLLVSNAALEHSLLKMQSAWAKQQDAVRKEFEELQSLRHQLETANSVQSDNSETVPARRNASGFRQFGTFVGGLMGHAFPQGHSDSQRGELPAGDGCPLEIPIEAAAPSKCFYPEVVRSHHHKVHGGGANAIVFAPSGMSAGTCGNDGVVRLWGTDNGQLTTEFSIGGGRVAGASVYDLCFANSGSAVLGACSDQSVKLWDVHTGRVQHTLTGHTAAVTGITQHPYSTKVAASCGDDRCIRIWSLDNGFCSRTIMCPSKPLSLSFTSDGAFIVSTHFNGSVATYEPSTGSLVHEIKGVHTQAALAVTPTGIPSNVVTCGKDSVLALTDISMSKVKLRIHNSGVFHVGAARCRPSVSPDDAVVAVGSASGMIVLFNLKAGTVHSQLSAHTSPVTGVAWNVRGEDYAVCMGTVDRGGDVVFWKNQLQSDL